jgi:phosphoribosylaminoimidazolecarboxamide formyltransferase/IMP cyclohydrolase
LAAAKADTWYLRQHPATLSLKFKPDLHRPDRDNAIDLFLRDDFTTVEHRMWMESFSEVPRRLTAQEKQEWLQGLKQTVLASDGYIPFRDTIDRAERSGVNYIIQPGGSLRDRQVIEACDEYELVMIFTGVRLFHH